MAWKSIAEDGKWKLCRAQLDKDVPHVRNFRICDVLCLPHDRTYDTDWGSTMELLFVSISGAVAISCVDPRTKEKRLFCWAQNDPTAQRPPSVDRLIRYDILDELGAHDRIHCTAWESRGDTFLLHIAASRNGWVCTANQNPSCAPIARLVCFHPNLPDCPELFMVRTQRCLQSWQAETKVSVVFRRNACIRRWELSVEGARSSLRNRCLDFFSRLDVEKDLASQLFAFLDPVCLEIFQGFAKSRRFTNCV
jgi:hypothetical protein